MNDIENLLKEEIKEKKQACSGYRYKKNGSKSKKCNLPSDHLSKKEIEKMNGECKVYNINKPMTYKDFCAIPVDIQIMYLENLRNKYGAGLFDIAKMMGCNYTTLSEHKRKFLDGKPGFVSHNTSRLDEKAWNVFINGEETCNASEADPEEENLGDTCSDYKHIEADIVSGSMTLKGNADDIFRKMADILGYENEYEICIRFSHISK